MEFIHSYVFTNMYIRNAHNGIPMSKAPSREKHNARPKNSPKAVEACSMLLSHILKVHFFPLILMTWDNGKNGMNNVFLHMIMLKDMFPSKTQVRLHILLLLPPWLHGGRRKRILSAIVYHIAFCYSDFQFRVLPYLSYFRWNLGVVFHYDHSPAFAYKYFIPLWNLIFDPALYTNNAPPLSQPPIRNLSRITTNPNDLPQIIPTLAMLQLLSYHLLEVTLVRLLSSEDNFTRRPTIRAKK